MNKRYIHLTLFFILILSLNIGQAWVLLSDVHFATEHRKTDAVVLNIERDNGFRKLTVEYYDEATGKKAIGISRKVYLDYANSLHIGKQISILYLSGSRRVYIPELKHPSWRTVHVNILFQLFTLLGFVICYRSYKQIKLSESVND